MFLLPDQTNLEETYRHLKQVHATAYGWNPPALPMTEMTTTRRMHSHVRAWITQWDVHRLYPEAIVRTEETQPHPDLCRRS